MSSVSEARLLAIWEAAVDRPPLTRALVLAAAGGADPGAVADLSVGRRDGYLLALRENCFGELYPSVVMCPRCGEELEVELSAAEVHAASPGKDRGSVNAGGRGVEFRLITSRDLDEITGRPDARRDLIQRCLTSVGGGDPVGALDDSALDAVSAAMAGLDPQAAVCVDLTCAACGHGWAAPFDVAGYLWAELNAHAARILGDVHALATVYGWSEAEVLAVGPARRRYYLEMAAP